MIANHVFALKAIFTFYGLKHNLLDDPKVKHFIRSMRLTRHLNAAQRNIMSLELLSIIWSGV